MLMLIAQGGQDVPSQDAFKTAVKLPGLAGENEAGKPTPVQGPSGGPTDFVTSQV